MTRTTGRLAALKVARAVKRPGMYCDGGGLYLQVTEGGASWIYRYRLNKRSHEMGLGPLALFGLAEARAKALDARRLRHEGIDPIKHRRDARAQQQLDAAKAITFQQCADAYIKAHCAGWRNARHSQQWTTTLATYAGPIIGALPVAAVDTALVLKVLEPIWTEKPETATRVRGRIERVLDWAKVRGYRSGENVARWKGHLDHLLPTRSKVRMVEHHAALPYGELPGFMAELRHREDITARALEFAILTAARAGEAIGARWSEFDLVDKTWIVPAERMKTRKPHRVPLAPRALAILEEMQAHRASDDAYVFPGSRSGRTLSNTALLELRQRMGRTDITTHGFRSTFRDWCSDQTRFSSEAAEIALSHIIGSKSTRAYARSDLLDERRRLMDAWASYCWQPASVEAGKVVALQGR